MKLIKTIQFDPSDTFVFENTAQAGDWAIPGGFMFASLDDDSLSGKTRQAFKSGFLSLGNFGWSTFVSVSTVEDATVDLLTQKLADFLCHDFNAPTRDAAIQAATAELSFAAEICSDVLVNTVFSLQREFDDEKNVKEFFRIVEVPRGAAHTKIWEIIEE